MGILKTLDVEVSMYCSLLRRNIYIYIIVSGMAGSEVISILDPCWGLETNGKSVGHDHVL